MEKLKELIKASLRAFHMLFLVLCFLAVATFIIGVSMTANTYAALFLIFFVVGVIAWEYATGDIVKGITDTDTRVSILKIKIGLLAIVILYIYFLCNFDKLHVNDIVDFYYKIWTDDFDKDKVSFGRLTKISFLVLVYFMVSAFEVVYEFILKKLVRVK